MSSVLAQHAISHPDTTAAPPRLKLILEDGTEYEGASFAANRPVVGEVVFTTGMSGYVETLTDPSFRTRSRCRPTARRHYGVPAPRPEGSMERPYESDSIQIQGLVVQHAITRPSHHASARTLGEWLASENIPGVTGIDTRTLTRRLREHGTMRGWLLPAGMPVEAAAGRERRRDAA
jgi:carbamoyl-phosphate synthase small subunit